MEKVHQHGLCTTGRRLCFYAIAIVDELFRLALSIALTVALSVQLVPVSAQAPAAKGAAAKATGSGLKTIWGDPDLQGLWTADLSIPLQRDPKLGDREFFGSSHECMQGE